MNNRPGDSGDDSDDYLDNDYDDDKYTFGNKSNANLILSVAEMGFKALSTGLSAYFENKREKDNQIKRIEELNNQIIEQEKENSKRHKEKDEQIKALEIECKKFKESSIIVDELKAKEQNQKENEAKALQLFKEEKGNFLVEYQLNIIESLKEKVDKYFSSILPLKFNVDTIKVIVNNFSSTVNLKEALKEFIKRTATKKLQELLKSLMHFNIVLAGKTGVGKSTLINAFLHLNLDENKALTGIGQPITQKITQYESNTIPTFRLWDNRGIEIDQYGIEQVVADIKNLVDTQAKKDSLDDYIHAIWYCVSTPGLRFEEIEKDAFKQISQIYDGDKLPVILVMTQCYFPDDVQAFKAMIKKIVPDNINIIEVVANKKPGILSEPFGLDKLLTITAQKASKATGAACYHCIQLHLKDTFDTIITQKKNKSKEILQLQLSNPDKVGSNPNQVCDTINDLNSLINDHLRGVLNKITLAFMSNDNSFITINYSVSFIDQIISNVSLMAKNALEAFVNEEVNNSKQQLSLLFVDLIKMVERESNCSLPYQKCEREWIDESTMKITQTIRNNSIIDVYQAIAHYVCIAYIDVITQQLKTTFQSTLNEMSDELKQISQLEVEKETQKILNTTFELKMSN